MFLLLACAAPDDTRSPAERLDAALPGLAAAVGRYTADLGPVADVVSAADPRLTAMLLPLGQAPAHDDRRDEHPDVDLREAGVSVEGTVLTGFVRGRGVAETGGWLLLDGRGGPSPDLLLGFGPGWIRVADADDWVFGPQRALAGTSAVEDDTVTFTVDLASTGRLVPGHAGPVTALVRSRDGQVWDTGPAGVTGVPDTDAVATLVALFADTAAAGVAHAPERADPQVDPDLAVAVALAYGGWRGLVAPAVVPVVEADARARYAYGLALDPWLADRGADWSLAAAPPAAKLLWAWPSAQNVVYSALPVSFAAERLSLARYRFHVPDAATLTALRDEVPLGETAWDTTLTLDDAIWEDLDYRASDTAMAALCDDDVLDAQTCFRWARDHDKGATLGVIDGVPVPLDKGTSVSIQLAARAERGAWVGDCATATHLVMAGLQSVGLVPLGVGYAGKTWGIPTHDMPLVLEGDRFVAPQHTPGARWHGVDTFVYVAVPALDPARGAPLGFEPDGWARGGSVAGGTMSYAALERWIDAGIPLSTALGWTEAARTGDWPEVGVP